MVVQLGNFWEFIGAYETGWGHSWYRNNVSGKQNFFIITNYLFDLHYHIWIYNHYLSRAVFVLFLWLLCYAITCTDQVALNTKSVKEYNHYSKSHSSNSFLS